MKYLLFTLLVTVPTYSFCINVDNSQYLGIWKSRDGYRSIEISQEKRKMKVRTHYHTKWRSYKREGYGIYEDCYGNRITFISPNTLEWYSISGTRIRYFKTHRDVHIRKDKWSTYRSNLSGVWLGRNNALAIDIQRTQEGIRVRRDGIREWYYYHRLIGSPELYMDRYGNQYHVVDRDAIHWVSYDKGVRLTFYKK